MMTTYQWKANSNSAPFFSDPSEGFIEADDPMTALRKVVSDYEHSCGFFSAVILEPTPENPVVARYLSARAATVERLLPALRNGREMICMLMGLKYHWRKKFLRR